MSLRTEPVTINLGPQHPSTHGVFRLKVTFDGEQIVDAEPVIGYMHRGTEKLAEERSYVQIVTLTDRLDWVSSMTNNLSYVRTVEKLASIDVPIRAQYLRVICSELQRIASHLIATGFLMQELGTFGGTPLMELYLLFETAKKILDQKNIKVSRSLIGNYTTSLDMAGGSITVTKLDQKIAEHWDSPVHTAALRWKM